MKKKVTRLVKSQSILEYLITLTAIVVAIIIGTIGFKSGVDRSLGIAEHEITNDYTNDRDAPEFVQEQAYYTPPSEDMFEQAEEERDDYDGPQLSGNYHFQEGSSNTDHVPEVEEMMDSDYSFTAPPIAGTAGATQ